MKRMIPFILIFALLNACGAPAAEPSPTPSATPEQCSTPSDLTAQKPDTNGDGMSPYAAWATEELLRVRENEYLDDENKIIETVELFIYLSCEQICEPEYGRYRHFDAFFDKTSEGYENLAYNSTETRYLGLMDAEPTMYGPIVWYDYDVKILSVEIDGDTAKVEAMDQIRKLRENYSGMQSGAFYYYLDLRKVSGVWLMTDVFPVSRYSVYGSYDELVEAIKELEAQYKQQHRS